MANDTFQRILLRMDAAHHASGSNHKSAAVSEQFSQSPRNTGARHITSSRDSAAYIAEWRLCVMRCLLLRHSDSVPEGHAK